jgi:cyclophilin family peptidyl-prolyl cis-trans isomerase/HEAT repeat protein
MVLAVLAAVLGAGCSGASQGASPPPAASPAPARAAVQATVPQSDAPSALPSAVLSDSDAKRYAGLLAMSDSRQPDAGTLSRDMSAKSSPLRVAAVRAAGQMDVEDLAPKLRGLLRDRDTAVAATAAYSLGLMRDTESVDALAAAVGITSRQPTGPARGQGPVTVVSEAAWALGQIGQPARRALMRALNDGVAPPGVLYAAARLRPLPTAALTGYFWPGDPDRMRAAVYAVTRSREAAAVRALLDVAQAPDPITRSYVARGLARSATGDSLSAFAFRALTTLVTDTSAVVRIEALGSLRGYGPPAQELVLQGTRDSMATVRLAAAAALDSTLVGAPSVLWRRAFDADTALAYRTLVAGAAIQDGVMLPVLDPKNPDRWAASRDWRYRVAAAKAAAGLPLERTLELALPAASDSDARVRTAAVEVIVSAIDSVPPDGRGRGVVPDRLSERWARDSDVGVRTAWLAAMQRLGPRVRNVPLVLESYRTGVHDSTVDAQVAVVHYVADAWLQDSDKFTPAMRTDIATLPPPANWAVLDEARGISLFNSWRPDAPHRVPRSADWYERVVRDVVAPSLDGHAPRVAIATVRGVMEIELYGADAPLTVANFLSLIRNGYYGGGTVFHRVVPGFVAQDGDPRGDGNGGPGYTITDELNRRPYDRGAVGMALSGPETGGSQYFVTITPQPHLDGHYTTFGHLTRGYEALDHLVPGDRITGISLVAQQ